MHLGIKYLHAAVDMRGDVMIKPRSLASMRRIRRARGEGGFTLIEAVFAMVLFAGLAAAMAGLLTSAISSNKLSRQRTIADQVAMEQIESIRRLDYEDVGTILGNPPGTVAATTPVSVVGFDATVTIQIRYVDDPTPTSYETTANYKRVVVTVRRDVRQRLARPRGHVCRTDVENAVRRREPRDHRAARHRLRDERARGGRDRRSPDGARRASQRRHRFDRHGLVQEAHAERDRQLPVRLLRPDGGPARVRAARCADAAQRRPGPDRQPDDPDLPPEHDQPRRPQLGRDPVHGHGVREAHVSPQRDHADVHGRRGHCRDRRRCRRADRAERPVHGRGVDDGEPAVRDSHEVRAGRLPGRALLDLHADPGRLPVREHRRHGHVGLGRTGCSRRDGDCQRRPVRAHARCRARRTRRAR